MELRGCMRGVFFTAAALILCVPVIGSCAGGKEAVVSPNSGGAPAADWSKEAAACEGAYNEYVLAPIAQKRVVRLENDDMTLVFKPDMDYTLFYKKTGKETSGRTASVTSLSRRGFRDVREGITVYLLETDTDAMSADVFLYESNFMQTAQIALVPVQCTSNEVVYRYKRPEALAGQELSFTIVRE